MSARAKLKQRWEVVACWLPNWMVGWYWRAEAERKMERLRRLLSEPEIAARLKAMPATHYICRACRHFGRMGESHDCA